MSHCGCTKEAFAWGQGGHHYRRASPLECYRRWTAQERGRDGCMKASDPDECEANGGCVYAGMPIAYERCPRYQEAVLRTTSQGEEKKIFA